MQDGGMRRVGNGIYGEGTEKNTCMRELIDILSAGLLGVEYKVWKSHYIFQAYEMFT